mmetsp:Transcript_121821/g.327198  ORF Transcript_121821/g.327198 Transcript_121821/m.327198 type:complete len:385 (+) Transcript_121821:110-1264(+)
MMRGQQATTTTSRAHAGECLADANNCRTPKPASYWLWSMWRPRTAKSAMIRTAVLMSRSVGSAPRGSPEKSTGLWLWFFVVPRGGLRGLSEEPSVDLHAAGVLLAPERLVHAAGAPVVEGLSLQLLHDGVLRLLHLRVHPPHRSGQQVVRGEDLVAVRRIEILLDHEHGRPVHARQVQQAGSVPRKLAAGRHVVRVRRPVVHRVQRRRAAGHEALQGRAADDVAGAAAEASVHVEVRIVAAVLPPAAPEVAVRSGRVGVPALQGRLHVAGVHVVVLPDHDEPVGAARRALCQEGGLLAGDRGHVVPAVRLQDVLALPLLRVVVAANGHVPALCRGPRGPRRQLGEQGLVVLGDGAGEDGVHHLPCPFLGDLADGVAQHGHRFGS